MLHKKPEDSYRGIATLIGRRIPHKVEVLERNLHVIRLFLEQKYKCYVVNAYIPPTDTETRDRVLACID